LTPSERDNKGVYSIIKQLILEGAAWSFITPNIDRAADERQAWLALRAQCELYPQAERDHICCIRCPSL